jgi:glutathione S-transferase
MRLFHAPHCGSQAATIVINELGLACDVVKTNLSDRSELLKYNPQGKVPTLVLDNGQVLTECAVIMQYLADQKPEGGLLPKVGTWERYKTLEAVNFVATEIYNTLSVFFVKDISEETRTFHKAITEKKLEVLNSILGRTKFLAANQYTIADIYCYVVISWTKELGLDMGRYPNILGYCERLSTRPAIIRAVATDSGR